MRDKTLIILYKYSTLSISQVSQGKT